MPPGIRGWRTRRLMDAGRSVRGSITDFGQDVLELFERVARGTSLQPGPIADAFVHERGYQPVNRNMICLRQSCGQKGMLDSRKIK